MEATYIGPLAHARGALCAALDGAAAPASTMSGAHRRSPGTELHKFKERVKDWKELLGAERTRTTIEATADEKWDQTITATKERQLNDVDERIDKLRKKLGFLPSDE